MSFFRRPFRSYFAAVSLTAMVLLALVSLSPGHSAAASLGQLHSQLGAQQARQQSLDSSIASLNRLIASLDSQISLVQSREATVTGELAADRAELARVQNRLADERRLLIRLRARLAKARRLLGHQLLSSYETPRPDLVSVVLDAHGFNDLLEQVNFLGRAEHEQQTLISITRTAKAQATAAAHRLARLQRTDTQVTAATELRARALAGMNALLSSRQSALSSARAAQADALAASRAEANALHQKISRAEAQQAAAAAASRAAAAAAQAQQRATATPAPPPAPTGAALGPSGGWAIPYAIVLCESGGQNDPPNSAGASGYYQIIPSTWKGYGGSGPAAYLAPKSEQDAVARRIWNGAGASAWVCAGIVGIH